jgi:hypothetical protein
MGARNLPVGRGPIGGFVGAMVGRIKFESVVRRPAKVVADAAWH